MSRFAPLAAFLFSLFAVPAGAAVPADIEVTGYVRGLPPTVQNTAAYLVISNNSGADVVLTGARSASAAGAAVHETVTENGQMLMRHRPSVTIPAGGELVLESGGLHLMLTQLRAPLREGDVVELTLVFEGGLEKALSLPVRDVRNEAAGHAH